MSIWDKVEAAEVGTEGKKSFDPLPDGTWTAEVTDITIKEMQEWATSVQLDDGTEEIDVPVKISIEFTLTESYAGRKVWYNTMLSSKTSPKAITFFKAQVCKLAGVESTNGDPQGVLANCKGNLVQITTKNVQSTKDPSKTFTNVYVDKCLQQSEALPF